MSTVRKDDCQSVRDKSGEFVDALQCIKISYLMPRGHQFPAAFMHMVCYVKFFLN